jgi:membrane protease YdiL (CAAX protease family)
VKVSAKAILVAAAALALTCATAAVFEVVRTASLARQQAKQLAVELDELPAYRNAVRVALKTHEHMRSATVTARFDVPQQHGVLVMPSGESLYSHYWRILEARGWHECQRQIVADIETPPNVPLPGFCRGEASAVVGPRLLFLATPGWYDVTLEWSRPKGRPWLVALGFLWTASLSTIVIVPSVRDRFAMTGVSRPEAALLATVPTIAISLANGAYLEAAYRLSPALFWMLDSLHFISVPAITLWLLRRATGITPRDYGLGPVPGDALRAVIAYVLGALAVPATYVIARRLVSPLVPGPKPLQSSFTYVAALPEEVWLRGLLILYLAVTAAIVEEIMFRGLPAFYASMMPDQGRARFVYYLASPALFGGIHWENGRAEVVAAAILGLVAAVLYQRLGSLRPLILGHSLTDLGAFSGLL